MAEVLAGSFIHEPDVERVHSIVIDAPVHIVLDVAEHLDLHSIPTINGLFTLRRFLLHARPKPRSRTQALVSDTTAVGWIRLAQSPGRSLAMGAIAQPWIGDVEFESIRPEEFSGFSKPGFVKIVWTIEGEALDPHTTLLRTQTRVRATDDSARKRFFLYWLFAGPFVSLIRILALRAIRKQAERRLM